MNIHQSSIAQSLANLKSSPKGLSASEAKRRLAEFGPNRLEEEPREHLWMQLAREFTHFFAMLLWVAAALAFIADHFVPNQGMAHLGIAIIAVIIINGVFSFWQQYRASQAIVALRRLLPQQSHVLRDSMVLEVLAMQIVPGDIVLLEAGDFIPADCRLIEAVGLRVNTATITGESLPVPKDTTPCAVHSPMDAKNVVLAGTFVLSGQARAVVYATGAQTEFGRIAHLTQTAGASVSTLYREISRLSKILAWIATGIGLVFFLVGEAIHLPIWTNLIFCIGIIVANVPEGLLPLVTLSLAMATQRMAKRNALVRHLPAVEALGATTTICCDKTGTLTQNRMSVQQIWLSGTLYTPNALSTQTALLKQHASFFLNALLCHNLKHVLKKNTASSMQWVGDPMEVALVAMAKPIVCEPEDCTRVADIAFDTDRKRMSVIYTHGDHATLYCKGAPETVIPLCRHLQVGAALMPLDASAMAQLLNAQQRMTDAGLRVLACAHRFTASSHTCEECDLVLSGLVGLQDPPKEEVPAAIKRCLQAGVRVIMVTGDHPNTALAIARQIGLVQSAQPVLIHGDELKAISPAQLQLALDAKEIIFARVAAEQKMLIVQALQAKGEIVAVTGDGVNDAPALKVADIGIAMGVSGTDVAKSTADIILLDDNFASIVAAIEEGRAVYDNIQKFLTYILSSNMPELMPYLAFVLFKIPLALTVIQILAVDLGTDMLPALALGTEKPSPSVMLRPPRKSHDRLLSWRLLVRAYLFLGMLEAAGAMAVFLFVLHTLGWQKGDVLTPTDPLYLQATSACLATIVVMQMINVLLCRHPFQPSLSFKTLNNPRILLGLIIELAAILWMIYTQSGNWLFNTAPISLQAWGLALSFALMMLAAEECRKWYCRKMMVHTNT